MLYAITLGTASALEAVMFWRAQQASLFRMRMRDDVFRANLLAALAPVLVFALSIPVAYVAPEWAFATWLLIFPLEWFVDRRFRPDDAEEF